MGPSHTLGGPVGAGTPAGPGDPLPKEWTTIPKPTTLATGQLNNSDQLDVELHQPADLPAFILVKWPAAPSVASPDNFTDLVAAGFRVLAEARVTVSRMRGDRRTR